MNNGVERTGPHYFRQKISAPKVTRELRVRLSGGKSPVDSDDIITPYGKQVTNLAADEATSTRDQYHRLPSTIPPMVARMHPMNVNLAARVFGGGSRSQ